MDKKNRIRINLIKSILFGLIFPIIFFWLFFDINHIKPLVNEYRLIAEKKITTIGIITKAKVFEDYVESNEGRKIQKVSGYEFNYTFISKQGNKINSKSGCFGDLPNDKKLSNIPFQVNIEYIANDPKINRIISLRANNEGLWDLFRRELFLPLLLLIACCYVTFIIIKKAINKFKIDIKYCD